MIFYYALLRMKSIRDFLRITYMCIQGNLVLDIIEDIKSIADEKNKSLVIGEIWLYTCGDKEISQLHYLDVYTRENRVSRCLLGKHVFD